MLIRLAVILVLLSSAIGARADAPDISKMIIGSNILQVVQTRQLTFREDGDVQDIALSPNGRYVVYLTVQPNSDSANRIGRLYLTRLSGGKPALLMEGALPDHGGYPDNPEWSLPHGISWSPDSRMIAFVAGWKDVADVPTDDAEKAKRRMEALVFCDTSGARTDIYYVADGSSLMPGEWSPDSSRYSLVCMGSRSAAENGGRDIAVISYNVQTKQAETLLKKTSRIIMIESWIENGKGLLCVESNQGVFLHHKLYVDGRAPVEYEQKPDGLSYVKTHGIPFDIKNVEGGVDIVDIDTGNTLCTVKGLTSRELSPVPKGRLVGYRRKQTIQDGPNGQNTVADSFWLMYPEGGKQNRMCVALGIRLNPLNISDGCLRIGYVDKGRAFVVELELRKATPREKAAGGLQLTEDEARSLMLDNARQIADAIGDHLSNSEYYPSQENFTETIRRHLRDASALLRPGTDRIAITYFRPDEKYHIGNKPPADTLIAALDGGYSWQIRIFADGRVEEALK